MPTQPKFKVKHELVKQRNKILMRRFKDTPYDCFKIRLYIEGDIDELKSVRYELHPSFPRPNQLTTSRSGGFPIEIWTWGEFEINVTFNHKDGIVTETVYHLKYSKELSDKDEDYIDVSPPYLQRTGR